MRFGWARAAAVALVLGTAACGQADAAGGAAGKNAADAAFFLKSNAGQPRVVTLPSGLQYKVVQSGPSAGRSPDINDLVRLHYEGSLRDGTVFDSSFDRGQPLLTAPEGFGGSPIIAGWTEILQKMKPGDEWIVYVPPGLGYGEAGAPGTIPPNAVLVFRIQMLDVAHTPDDIRTIPAMTPDSANG